MRSHFAFLFVCAAILVICGCEVGKSNAEAKIAGDIKFVRRAYLDASSPVFRQWGTNILAAFSSVSARTVAQPQFATATMGVDQEGEFRLYVFWIEEKSSIDGVELHSSQTDPNLVVAIKPFDLNANAKESKTSVLMAADWIWFKTNDICAQFKKISDVSDIKVRLLTSGKPASSWNPVSFYRLDHWMGSKEILQITNGPASLEIQKK